MGIEERVVVVVAQLARTFALFRTVVHVLSVGVCGLFSELVWTQKCMFVFADTTLVESAADK